jgi:peptidoglycan/LPS O-acetylase OafA/YrhL
MNASPAVVKTQPLLNLSRRIPELDGLRGLAIGMVLLCHFFFFVIQVRPGSAAAYLLVTGRLTWSGVDLFFVLSGFLIGGILQDARGSSNYFRVFYTRRFFRIVPIYVVLLASVGITFHLWRAGFIGKFEKVFLAPLPWPTFVVFLQNFAMARRNDIGLFPLGVTWSLAVEEQFYLTLPLLVRFLDRRALLRFILFAVPAAPLLRAFFFYRDPTNLFSWYTLMPCRADSLLLGVLGAIALRDPRWRAWLLGHRRLLSLALAFFLAGLAFLGWRSPNFAQPLMATVGFTWLALTYLSFLLYALLFPESWMSRCLRWGWLRGLGVIAYGTYLFHEFFLSLFFRRVPWVGSWRDLGVSVLTLAFTLVFCRLSWLYFEKPLVKLGHRTSYNFDSKQSNTAVAPLPTEGDY